MNNDTNNGYMGRILEVNLSERTIDSIPLASNSRELFVGGRALAVALLFQQLNRNGISEGVTPGDPIKETDPLSKDNVLVFCTSPAIGTNVPTASRIHVAFKSPLTGGIGSSSSGGKWGVEFKKTGFDALVVKGCAEKLSVLIIDDNGPRLEPAPEVNPADVDEVTDAVQSVTSKKHKVMTVGGAGRNLSPIACIINDRGRALGRGGSGAVFGSKNLLAIAVRGEESVAVSNQSGLDPKNTSGSVYKAMAKLRVGKITKAKKQYGILSSMGTNGLMGMLAQYDELLHKNFLDNRHDDSDLAKIQGEAFLHHDRVKVKGGACLKCPIGCTRVSSIVDEDGNVVSSGEGPEFETVSLLGANLHIYDLEAVTQANYLCNRYGFDTISIGGTIAALMEIYERIDATEPSQRTEAQAALMTEAEPFVSQYGAPVFGNTRCLVPLVEAAAANDGIGQIVAQGSKRLARQLGHPEVSMTVKGMELPAYDPRATWTQGLSYMMSPRGGCHLQGGYSAPLAFCAGYGEFPGNKVEGAALVARNVCYQNIVYDMLGVCAFAGFSVSLDEMANMLNDVVGAHYKASDLEHIAKRCLILERLFNHRCGFTPQDDWLPERFFDNAITVDGVEMKCSRTDFSRMRHEFYESLGLDEDGLPTEQTLGETLLREFLQQIDADEPLPEENSAAREEI
ncbi:MAG: aldehyde ferredoxin oxidoreductase C-terminal domain-containing protein [Phycisphaerae bacterium]|nr:aldehyde ferredoxin oxidoreductase C-terminal domain-containing protein [Phycisphaerae bacterium]